MQTILSWQFLVEHVTTGIRQITHVVSRKKNKGNVLEK